ncbi:MAG: hypothetical protein CVV48_09825 [Spirochaetae bacterium HGW-Spirochaetae-4]|jgi:menaquinone-dependent protoporphyrinogen oxidase|nr:MAG: hypothetical protein CVV48_09825 [Spirochaetae bacterium HGW-Spirochaetae-4]HCS36921.1 hypothetical protein [Sphaerochaeta sp.]
MPNNILIAYGSKRGATKEIAEKIGEALGHRGCSVDVSDAGIVKDIAPYDTVILGSSVYIGLWHRSAVRFLKTHGESLEKLPVWIFICGPTGKGNPIDQMEGWFYPKSLQPIMERIHPQDITCFGGRLSLGTLNPFEKWIIKKVEAPEGDFRNWEAIGQWATSTVSATPVQ